MPSKLPITQEQLKETLLESGIIVSDDWEQAEKNALRRRRGVEEVLIERGFFNEQYLYEMIGAKMGVEYVNLRKRKLDQSILDKVEQKIVREVRAVPFGMEGDALKVAFVDPNAENVQAIAKDAGLKIVPFLTSFKNFAFAARLYQKNIKEELADIFAKQIPKVDGKIVKMELPIIKIVDAILEYAMFEQASDIHIEALPDAVVVRFRIDGELKDMAELPVAVHDALVARIKILANMRIDEHRVPQDGRFSFKVEDEEESVRVSVLPAFYGEKVVMRLLTNELQNISLEDLGFTEKNIRIMNRQVKKPFGMILVVGPTGSGKTTTLYSVLNILNTESVNIVTIEDPIEYGIHRINQTQVNQAAGYTFANGLRALLRQDPDVIMIGEIRDNDTAQIAVRAGLTGHLVLSTLHTNNAAGAPPRLLDMGVEPFLAASTLNVVIAQRLVRKICKNCIISFKLTKDELVSLSKEFDLENMLQRFKDLGIVEKKVKSFSELSFYKGKGCNRCDNSGYDKRIGVLEILENTEAVQKAIIKNSASNDIQQVAVNQGMVTIFEDGMQKALLGVTTIEEVLRIKRE